MFFENYKKLCAQRGISPSKAADDCGINRSTVTAWKKSGYVPRQDILLKLADYFGVSVDYLLGNEKNEPSDIERLILYAYHDPEEPHPVEKEVSLENIKALNKLLKSARDLSPEKIDALIKVAENMK